MSTESNSLIRVTRKKRQCAKCDRPLYPGDKYLSYAPGQRRRIPFCTSCMVAEPSLSYLRAVLDYQSARGSP